MKSVNLLRPRLFGVGLALTALTPGPMAFTVTRARVPEPLSGLSGSAESKAASW